MNQDRSYYGVGTTKGYYLYKANSQAGDGRGLISKDEVTSDVGEVQLLAIAKTNIVAFVTGGAGGSSVVHVFDDHKQEDLALLTYKEKVTGLKITNNQ